MGDEADDLSTDGLFQSLEPGGVGMDRDRRRQKFRKKPQRRENRRDDSGDGHILRALSPD